MLRKDNSPPSSFQAPPLKKLHLLIDFISAMDKHALVSQ